MPDCELIDQIVNTWRVHDRINSYLLEEMPKKGLEAVPLASRGRDVAQVFAHMHKVRFAWLRVQFPRTRLRHPTVPQGSLT